MINRRQVVKLGASTLACHALGVKAANAAQLPMIKRPIPSSGEMLPVMGMGTSRTFDTDDDPQSLAKLGAVMQAFFESGGTIVDSSPMYGNAESRVGDVLRAMDQRPKVFAATKVWTTGREKGIEQMEESARRMDVQTFDLIAVHNLKDWKTHLATLKAWKKEGRVRYIGITTSHGRDHDRFIDVMRAEETLLPLAQSRGIATMINRPYQRGALFKKSRGSALPALAAELDCTSWGQFYLKFILGHPAVTCIIPATSKIHHMQDNMQANFGRVPDAAQREEMLRIFESL
jgi:diketogulonate reductase-like aldo/keto reductase